MPQRIRDLSAGPSADIAAALDAIDPADRDTSGTPAFVADPNGFLLVADVDDRPVGLAWGAHVRYPYGRRMTYLHQLDVVEHARRSGIGTALVEAAMQLGRAAGSSKFWLSTGAHNEVAQAVYDRLGGARKPLGDVNYWWDLD